MMAKTSGSDGVAAMDAEVATEERMSSNGERQIGTKKRKASPTGSGPSSAMADVRESVERVAEAYRAAGDVLVKVTGGSDEAMMFIQSLGTAIIELQGVIDTPALNAWAQTMENKPLRRNTMKDASTDTVLTPHWWESSLREDHSSPSDIRDAKKNTARECDEGSSSEEEPPHGGPIKSAGNRTYAAAARQKRSDSSSGMDVDDGFRTVVRRSRRKKTAATPPQRPTEARKKAEKPPAVMIKAAQGKSYAETVAAIKAVVNPAELGAEVRRIRRSAEGHTIVEFEKSEGAHEAASKLKEALTQKSGETVGHVQQMGNLVEAEIVDVDPTATKEDVMAALLEAVANNDRLSPGVITTAGVTGLWPTRAGTQVASVKLPRVVLDNLNKIKVGWTIARIRERAPAPTRCFRCHGFGHTKYACTGPDLTEACRKCGGNGHLENSCTAEGGGCVACERHGFHAPAHRTGSAGCPAWREAMKELRSETASREQANGRPRMEGTSKRTPTARR